MEGRQSDALLRRLNTMSHKITTRQRYERYRAKHPAPMSYKAWLYFREQGAKGGALSDNDKVAAGRAGVEARRKMELCKPS